MCMRGGWGELTKRTARDGSFALGRLLLTLVDLMHGTVRYEGSFYRGLKQGHGKFTWSSGAVYVGEWVMGRMDGTGTYIWPDDRRYEGESRRGGKGLRYRRS